MAGRRRKRARKTSRGRKSLLALAATALAGLVVWLLFVLTERVRTPPFRLPELPGASAPPQESVEETDRTQLERTLRDRLQADER